ncbi:hypothetical protein LPJ61_001810, partial [Coemansia biformis]
RATWTYGDDIGDPRPSFDGSGGSDGEDSFVEGGRALHAVGDVTPSSDLSFSSGSDASINGDGDSRVQMLGPASRSHESEDAWSFVCRDGSPNAADGPATARQDSVMASRADQRDMQPPPTFTAESSRAIYVDAGPRHTGTTESSDDQGAGSSSDSDFGEHVDYHFRQQHDRAPVVDPGMEVEHGHRREQAQHHEPPQEQQQQGRLREEPIANGRPVAPEGADVAAVPPGVPDDLDAGFDENMGEFDGADGLVEAMGFRGPLINATQYFVLVFMVVAMVLAFFAWLPYICGRAFVAMNPVRAFVGGTHVLMELIDAVGEFVVGLLPFLVWERIRPAVVVLTDTIGPLVVRVAAPLVPGTREALEGADGRLWNKLTSPSVQHVLLAKFRQSWIIRLLFPWTIVVPTRTSPDVTPPGALPLDTMGAGAAAASGSSSMSRQHSMLRSPVAYILSWTSAKAMGLLSWAAPTTGTRELSTSIDLPDWERKLWQRFINWGIPVDRIVQRLDKAAAGSTFDDRFLMIAIGHLLGVLSAWVIVAYTPLNLRRSALYGSARMFLRMAKIVFFIFIELMTFPVICGYCLDVSLMPLLSSASLASRYGALVEHRWMSLFTHWLLGMLFMIHFARFVLHCRQVMRPGLLWFIRDPNDPEFHPMREILEDRMLPQQYNIARSALMYCGVILSCVGLSMAAAVRAAPAMFPIQWAPSARFSDYPSSILIMVSLLPAGIMWGRPNEVLHFLFSHWWRLAARTARLSEFILGERRILDEGRWVLHRAPWLHVPLAGLWMPTHVVREVFDVFNESTFDRARTGPLAGAIPTSEYTARLQESIDRALAEGHPHVRFALNGSNYRVPAVDTVPVVPGRNMLVPVDGNGDPMDDCYDYEAADSPELRNAEDNQGRNLPAAAPESSYRDRRFRREHYGVIYVPPGLNVRVCLVLVLGWLAIATLSGTTLVLSLAIGRGVHARIDTMPVHDMYALSIGLLVLLVAAVLVFRTSTYLGDTFGRGNDRDAALRDFGLRAVQAWAGAWKITVTGGVFFGFVATVSGLVAEVYFVVPLRHALGARGGHEVVARTPLQAMEQNWIFGVLHVCVGYSVLRFFPALPLSRRLDRLFVGPPHTWHVWRGVVDLALPLLVLSAAAASLPFVLAAAAMWVRGSLTADAAVRMATLEDLRVLAPCVNMIICLALALVAARRACTLYRRWSRSVRDRVYLVGQQLHNIAEVETDPAREQAG